MSEKVMITGAKAWAERCKIHAGEEVRNGVFYVWFLLQQLAQLEEELEDERGLRYKTQNETSKRIYELEATTAELLETSEALLDAVHKHTVLGRGDWLNGLEENMKQAIHKAKATEAT